MICAKNRILKPGKGSLERPFSAISGSEAKIKGITVISSKLFSKRESSSEQSNIRRDSKHAKFKDICNELLNLDKNNEKIKMKRSQSASKKNNNNEQQTKKKKKKKKTKKIQSTEKGEKEEKEDEELSEDSDDENNNKLEVLNSKYLDNEVPIQVVPKILIKNLKENKQIEQQKDIQIQTIKKRGSFNTNKLGQSISTQIPSTPRVYSFSPRRLFCEIEKGIDQRQSNHAEIVKRIENLTKQKLEQEKSIDQKPINSGEESKQCEIRRGSLLFRGQLLYNPSKEQISKETDSQTSLDNQKKKVMIESKMMKSKIYYQGLILKQEQLKQQKQNESQQLAGQEEGKLNDSSDQQNKQVSSNLCQNNESDQESSQTKKGFLSVRQIKFDSKIADSFSRISSKIDSFDSSPRGQDIKRSPRQLIFKNCNPDSPKNRMIFQSQTPKEGLQFSHAEQTFSTQINREQYYNFDNSPQVIKKKQFNNSQRNVNSQSYLVKSHQEQKDLRNQGSNDNIIYYDIKQSNQLLYSKSKFLHLMHFKAHDKSRISKQGYFAIFHFQGVLGFYDSPFFGFRDPTDWQNGNEQNDLNQKSNDNIQEQLSSKISISQEQSNNHNNNKQTNSGFNSLNSSISIENNYQFPIYDETKQPEQQQQQIPSFKESQLKLIKGLHAALQSIQEKYIIIIILPQSSQIWKDLLENLLNQNISCDAVYAETFMQQKENLVQDSTEQVSEQSQQKSNDEKQIFLDYNRILADFKQKTVPKKFLIFNSILPNSLIHKQNKKVVSQETSIFQSQCNKEISQIQVNSIPFSFPKIKCNKKALKVIALERQSMNNNNLLEELQFDGQQLQKVANEFITEFREQLLLENEKVHWSLISLDNQIYQIQQQFERDIHFRMKKMDFIQSYNNHQSQIQQQAALNIIQIQKQKKIPLISNGIVSPNNNNNNFNNTTFNNQSLKQQDNESSFSEANIKQKIAKYFSLLQDKRFNINPTSLNIMIENTIQKNVKMFKQFALEKEEFEANMKNINQLEVQNEKDIYQFQEEEMINLVKKYTQLYYLYSPSFHF